MRIGLVFGAAIAAVAIALPSLAATTYYYDDLGRLWIASYDNGMQITYSYDAAGNRTQVVTQSGTNLPPTANPDYVNATVNTPLVILPLANDTDPNNGANLTISAVGSPPPANGTTTNTTTKITYTPNPSFAGTDSFNYTMTDGQYFSTATVFVTVIGCQYPPNAVNDAISTLHALPDTFDPRTNDTDPCAYSLTITNATSPTPHGGTVVVNNGTQLKYTPPESYDGSDSFSYTVSDGHGQTASATVTATDQSTDTAPVAVNDTMSTLPNWTYSPPGNNCGPYTVTPTGKLNPLQNDTDADGDALSIQSLTQPAHGTVGKNADGTVSYTYYQAVGSVSGTDSFTYTVTDGYKTAIGTVTVTLNVQRDVCG